MKKNNLKEIKQHGTEYFPCAFYIFENDKEGLTVKHHWHDQFELIHFKEGRFNVEVNLDKYIV